MRIDPGPVHLLTDTVPPVPSNLYDEVIATMNQYIEEDEKEDLRMDAAWETWQEYREQRAKTIWNDMRAGITYGEREDYYIDFLENNRLREQFNEWLVDQINKDYPEEE